MTHRPSYLAIIPARGGSKGLPGKNLLPVHGKPMLDWSVEAASSCARIHRVVVSTDDEKQQQLDALHEFHQRNAEFAPALLEKLKKAAWAGTNTFDVLMEAAKVCSLGQISRALYQVGGQYRRNV